MAVLTFLPSRATLMVKRKPDNDIGWHGSQRSGGCNKISSCLSSMLSERLSGRRPSRSWSKVTWCGEAKRRTAQLHYLSQHNPPVLGRLVDITRDRIVPHRPDVYSREGVHEACCWLESFVKARWGQHWEYITIDCALTLDELRQLGHLDRSEGWNACRRLVRIPVLNDEIALALWTRLKANARDFYVEQSEPRSEDDELDTWWNRHDALDHKFGVCVEEMEEGERAGRRASEDAEGYARPQQDSPQNLIDYSKALVSTMRQQLPADLTIGSREGNGSTPLKTAGESDPLTEHDLMLTETTGCDPYSQQFGEYTVASPFSEAVWSAKVAISGADDASQGIAGICERYDATREPDTLSITKPTTFLSTSSHPGRPLSFSRHSSVTSADSGFYSREDSISSASSLKLLLAKEGSRRGSAAFSTDTSNTTRPGKATLRRFTSGLKEIGEKLGMNLKKEKGIVVNGVNP